jgi:Cu-Zn family superoxide dismutase
MVYALAHPVIPVRRAAFGAGVAFVLALACAPAVSAIDDQTREAAARLEPTKGSTVSGTARFQAEGKDNVRITVSVKGLKPGAAHGLHVHEKGDCSAPDATSAGPHFALPDQRHGDGQSGQHHAGDLGNIKADEQGNAEVTITVPDSKLSLTGGPVDVVGRALVVHGGQDDLKSQPAGDSGPRMACGVVERRTIEDGKSPMKPRS